MPSRRRAAVAVLMTATATVFATAVAATADSPQDDGNFDSSYPDGFSSDTGVPTFFVAAVVLVILVGIAVAVWKVNTARTLATRSGMDPGLATQMTLLSENGLDATYLAASLRTPEAAATAAAPAAQRLAELKGLLDSGLITQAEHDERRTAIIGSI